jgi:hypothetical protein
MAKKVEKASATLSFVPTKDGKAIAAMTAWLKTSNATFMERMHITAVSCILHLVYAKDKDDAYTNNSDPADQLCGAVEGDKRINSLRRWFEQIGPYRWDNARKKLLWHKTKVEAMRSRDEAELTAELVKGITFWKLDPPKPYKGFDLREVIKAKVNEAEGKLEDIETGALDEDRASKVKVNAEDLAALKKLVANW